MARWLFLFFFITASYIGFAQRKPQYMQDTVPIYQFSGLVVGTTSQEPIPYVQVQVNHSKQGVFTNEDGFYSIPVTVGDTLYYYHVAYKATKLIVKKYLKDYKGSTTNYIYVVNYMKEDSFSLGTVYIYPWKNYDEVTTAITNMEIDHNSPDARARENLDPKVLDAVMKSMPMDGDERVVVGRQMYYDFYQRKNLMPTVGLNPVAIARMLKYVVDQTKQKRNKNLGYWEE